jgi:hypothetical protein
VLAVIAPPRGSSPDVSGHAGIRRRRWASVRQSVSQPVRRSVWSSAAGDRPDGSKPRIASSVKTSCTRRGGRHEREDGLAAVTRKNTICLAAVTRKKSRSGGGGAANRASWGWRLGIRFRRDVMHFLAPLPRNKARPRPLGGGTTRNRAKAARWQRSPWSAVRLSVVPCLPPLGHFDVM